MSSIEPAPPPGGPRLWAASAARGVAWLLSRLLLGAVFYGVFTPLAALRRLAGREPLGLAWRPAHAPSSWWRPRNPRPPSHFEKSS